MLFVTCIYHLFLAARKDTRSKASQRPGNLHAFCRPTPGCLTPVLGTVSHQRHRFTPCFLSRTDHLSIPPSTHLFSTTPDASLFGYPRPREMILYDQEQPEAGPSRRHRIRFPFDPSPRGAQGERGTCRSDVSCHHSPRALPAQTLLHVLQRQNQDYNASTVGSSTFPASATSSAIPVTATAGISASAFSNGTSYSSGLASATGTHHGGSIATSNATSPYYATESLSSTSTSHSFSRPWSTSTRSTSSHAAESTPYVSGVILPLYLAGDSDTQAVYSVPMDFGHGTQDASKRSSKWNGGDPQTVNLQIDLGSSDMVRRASRQQQLVTDGSGLHRPIVTRATAIHHHTFSTRRCLSMRTRMSPCSIKKEVSMASSTGSKYPWAGSA